MSKTAESITSTEAQDIRGHDVSSQSLHGKEQQPPPYSADPPSKDEVTGTSPPISESKSGTNTNKSISQSTKEESCSNKDPKASTDSKTGTSQPTTESQSCDDINSDASSDTSKSSQSTAKDESSSDEDAEASTDATTAPEKKPSSDADSEAPTDTPETPSPFEDQAVRRGFLRKVFCIQILMLLFTFGVVSVFTFSDAVKDGMKDKAWIFISSTIIFSIVVFILSIFKSYSRRHPWNLVGLAVVTLTLSFMLGTLTSYLKTNSVLIAMGYTIVISLAIIAFTTQSYVDFNIGYGFALIVIVIGIMSGIMYGILSSCCIAKLQDLDKALVFAGVGAFLLSLFLMIDIQWMTGRHKDRVDPEDYTTAALLIYLDTMLVFIWILQHLNK